MVMGEVMNALARITATCKSIGPFANYTDSRLRAELQSSVVVRYQGCSGSLPESLPLVIGPEI
jgi:hypothetical protein